MKFLAAMIASLSLLASSSAQANPTEAAMPSGDDVQMVAPALESYTRGRLLDEVWKRPGLRGQGP